MNDVSQPPKTDAVPVSDFYEITETLSSDELATVEAVRTFMETYALEAVNGGMQASQAQGLPLEAALFSVCAATEDKAEGTTAFLAKRAPDFQGR